VPCLQKSAVIRSVGANSAKKLPECRIKLPVEQKLENSDARSLYYFVGKFDLRV
jgi:hypothetical protein